MTVCAVEVLMKAGVGGIRMEVMKIVVVVTDRFCFVKGEALPK
jgi:hypothetical protein